MALQIRKRCVFVFGSEPKKYRCLGWDDVEIRNTGGPVYEIPTEEILFLKQVAYQNNTMSKFIKSIRKLSSFSSRDTPIPNSEQVEGFVVVADAGGKFAKSRNKET